MKQPGVPNAATCEVYGLNATTLTHDAIMERIRAAIRSMKGAGLSDGEIGEGTALWPTGDPDQASLGFDSLDFLELVVRLEDLYGWSLPEDLIDASRFQTVGDLAAVAQAVLGGDMLVEETGVNAASAGHGAS